MCLGRKERKKGKKGKRERKKKEKERKRHTERDSSMSSLVSISSYFPMEQPRYTKKSIKTSPYADVYIFTYTSQSIHHHLTTTAMLNSSSTYSQTARGLLANFHLTSSHIRLRDNKYPIQLISRRRWRKRIIIICHRQTWPFLTNNQTPGTTYQLHLRWVYIALIMTLFDCSPLFYCFSSIQCQN